MARSGKDNDHTKSGELRRQYRIQHVMMILQLSGALRKGVKP